MADSGCSEALTPLCLGLLEPGAESMKVEADKRDRMEVQVQDFSNTFGLAILNSVSTGPRIFWASRHECG